MSECVNRHPANSSGNCSNETCTFRISNRHTPVVLPPESDTQTENDSENWWDNDRAET